MILAVDTSAVIAVLLMEPEADRFADLMERHEALISTASVVEAARVMMSRRGPMACSAVRRLLSTFDVRTAPVTEAQAQLAVEGMIRFGIGRGEPPAVLNFGDLFAYALAQHLDAPLLFKGEDFLQTDVRAAWTP